MSASDSVRDFSKKAVDRAGAIRRRAVVLMGDELTRTTPQGGRVPFMTGTLSRSAVASTAGMPKVSSTPSAGSSIGVVAATLPPEQPVWLGYTVKYARRVNYGFVGADSLGRVYNQQGHHFVEGAVAEWPKIVRRAVKDVTGG